MNLADCIVSSTWHNIVCPKFLGQIESTFLFRVSLLSSVFLIYSVIFSCGFCGLDCPVPDLAPGEWVLASQVGRVQEASCFCCRRAVAWPCPHLSTASVLSTVTAHIVFYWIRFRPFSGACPRSLCLEYFVQDSLWPSFTWFPTILASAQDLWELIIPMGANPCGHGKTLYFCFLIYLSL